MAKRDGWGEATQVRRSPAAARNPGKAALFFVGIAGAGALLATAGWVLVGDILVLAGPVLGRVMVVVGVMLGGLAGLVLPLLLSRRAAGDSIRVRRLRVLSVVLVVMAISPALYFGLYFAAVVGTAFNQGNN